MANQNQVETTGNRALTNEQVIAIRKLRGNHTEPNMSYSKIVAHLQLPVGVIACEYAGRMITYSDVQGPKGWEPYPLAHTPSTIRRMERAAKRKAEQAAKKEAKKLKAAEAEAKKEAKKAPALKDEKGKLTEAGKAKALQLLAEGKNAKEVAHTLEINPSNVYRLAKKAA